MTETALDFKYTWADVYTTPKIQKIPDFINRLTQERDEADAVYMMLTDLEPIPQHAINEAGEKLDAATLALDRALDWYHRIPAICPNCGGTITAQGDYMKCNGCGDEYRPDYDLALIPF